MHEKRYTLDEAREELRRQECMTRGHDYRVEIRVDGEPAFVICNLCNMTWRVPREDA